MSESPSQTVPTTGVTNTPAVTDEAASTIPQPQEPEAILDRIRRQLADLSAEVDGVHTLLLHAMDYCDDDQRLEVVSSAEVITEGIAKRLKGFGRGIESQVMSAEKLKAKEEQDETPAEEADDTADEALAMIAALPANARALLYTDPGGGSGGDLEDVLRTIGVDTIVHMYNGDVPVIATVAAACEAAKRAAAAGITPSDLETRRKVG